MAFELGLARQARVFRLEVNYSYARLSNALSCQAGRVRRTLDLLIVSGKTSGYLSGCVSGSKIQTLDFGLICGS